MDVLVAVLHATAVLLIVPVQGPLHYAAQPSVLFNVVWRSSLCSAGRRA